MTPNPSRKRVAAVITAATLVVLLAATLALRVAAQPRSTAGPAGSVPAPRPIRLTELSAPFCWGCSWNEDAALEFQVDLDLLAPLGDGDANAAEWFADFARGETRFEDGKPSYASRMIELTIDGDDWRVLPGDDPLLLEAEPWIDQARCSFYPEIWEVEGIDTSVPQLLMMLDLARAWTVREGTAGPGSAGAAAFQFRHDRPRAPPRFGVARSVLVVLVATLPLEGGVQYDAHHVDVQLPQTGHTLS